MRISRMRHLDDQTIFWEGLRNGAYGKVKPLEACVDYMNATEDSDTFITCPLNGCQFAPGAVAPFEDFVNYQNLLEGLKARNPRSL